jgi:hypothetical protein
MQAAYYFGFEDALIRPNFADPDFSDCAARDRCCHVSTYFGSKEFERLDRVLGGLLSR